MLSIHDIANIVAIISNAAHIFDLNLLSALDELLGSKDRACHAKWNNGRMKSGIDIVKVRKITLRVSKLKPCNLIPTEADEIKEIDRR